MAVFVQKINGEREEYDPSKLKRSLYRAGSDAATTDKILAKVDKLLYDGIDTRKRKPFALATTCWSMAF